MSEELVYLLRGGPYHKIGRTMNLKQRIKTLQTGHPHRLEVVKTWPMPNSTQAETDLHHQFALLKVHGDWFDLTESDINGLIALDVIEATKRVLKMTKVSHPREPLAIAKLGTLRYLIESKTDIRTPGGLRERIPEMSRQQAWSLWHSKTTLGLRLAKRISQATEIPLDELAEVDEAVPGKPRQRKPKP